MHTNKKGLASRTAHPLTPTLSGRKEHLYKDEYLVLCLLFCISASRMKNVNYELYWISLSVSGALITDQNQINRVDTYDNDKLY